MIDSLLAVNILPKELRMLNHFCKCTFILLMVIILIQHEKYYLLLLLASKHFYNCMEIKFKFLKRNTVVCSLIQNFHFNKLTEPV